MKKKLYFIFNPRAGKGRIKIHLLEIVDIFNKGGYEVMIYSTQRPRDAYEKAKEYANKVDLIVCGGGDGTLDEVVTGVMEAKSKVPIGYIPAGSTNDFANSLFLPKKMVEAAQSIMTEKSYFCDIGDFNNNCFAYIAAFGLFTDVAYQTDQDLKNILGHIAYILEGIKRLFDIQSYKMKVVTENREIEDDFILGMITNSRSVGGFKNLTGKNVDMNDGLFEVTLVTKPKNPLELQEIIGSMLSGVDDTDLIYSFKTKQISLICNEDVPWTLDGEFGGSHREVNIKNNHEALHMYFESTKKTNKARR